MKTHVQLVEEYNQKKTKLREKFVSKLTNLITTKLKRVDAIETAVIDLQTERKAELNDIDAIQKHLNEA